MKSDLMSLFLKFFICVIVDGVEKLDGLKKIHIFFIIFVKLYWKVYGGFFGVCEIEFDGKLYMN